jgi:hypothetical protein
MTVDLVDMYDGISVSQWPAGVQYGLAYTDGRYANRQAILNRFPGITLQTISAVGQAHAMWIDCEPGCVWPPAVAVALYQRWIPAGCRGIYCAQSTKPAVRQAAIFAGVSPQIFGVDWTGVPHIVPGEAQTQYRNTPGFDVSSIPAPVPPVPAPGPAPTPTTVKADMMRVVVATSNSSTPPQHAVTAGQHFLLFGSAFLYVIESPADIVAWIQALGPAIPVTGGFLGNIAPLP